MLQAACGGMIATRAARRRQDRQLEVKSNSRTTDQSGGESGLEK